MDQKNKKKKNTTPPASEPKKIRKFRWKLIIIGEMACGKTSIIRQFVEKRFEKDYISTIGVNVSNYPITLNKADEEIQVELYLYDFAGQESFSFLERTTFEGSNAAIIVFDLTRTSTFDCVKEKWYPDLVKNTLGKIPIYLVGNKEDLKEKIQVTDSMINAIRTDLKFEQFYRTSALNGQNVGELFGNIGKVLLEKQFCKPT